mmetsp:Transcript_6414/g.578  ORF Transcript_6414/g.578 Transcript_6414/m.578 type:complete len:148 (-) Transcript_6414:472-915(-)
MHWIHQQLTNKKISKLNRFFPFIFTFTLNLYFSNYFFFLSLFIKFFPIPNLFYILLVIYLKNTGNNKNLNIFQNNFVINNIKLNFKENAILNKVYLYVIAIKVYDLTLFYILISLEINMKLTLEQKKANMGNPKNPKINNQSLTSLI